LDASATGLVLVMGFSRNEVLSYVSDRIFFILHVSRRIRFCGVSKLSRTYKETVETLTARKTLV